MHPRAQTDRENCTWHNFNVIPTYKGNIAVSGNYQSGISVIDFTNPALPKEIASADPAPLSTTSNVTGGDWSTYIHNGVLYESDIRRGLITWDLVDAAADRARTFALSNPQTQAISYEQDTDGPTIDIASPLAGARFEVNETVLASFSCADAGTGVESCVGTVADGAAIDTSSQGHEFTVTATDKAGNVSTKTVQYTVTPTPRRRRPDPRRTPTPTPTPRRRRLPRRARRRHGRARVPTALSLTMGAPATFGTFTPGIAKDYTAGTTVNVISTASGARLSVADPSATNTWQARQRRVLPAGDAAGAAASAGGTSAALSPVGAATSLLTYAGPVSNDAVTVTFTQPVGAGDALRTGTYSKSLTFTLATTTP